MTDHPQKLRWYEMPPAALIAGGWLTTVVGGWLFEGWREFNTQSIYALGTLVFGLGTLMAVFVVVMFLRVLLAERKPR